MIEEDTRNLIFLACSNILKYGCASWKAVTGPFNHLNEIHWRLLLIIGTRALEFGGEPWSYMYIQTAI